MSPKAEPALTPKIRRLVASDRLARPPVGRLTDEHVEALAAIARRRGRFDEDVSAPRAIAALASGAPEKALPVINAVLSDTSVPRSDRVAAARALGVIADTAAERMVLPHLPRAEPRVQQELLAALGTFGSARAARALREEVLRAADPALEQQLSFTRALIAHRHGLDGPFLPERAPAEPPRGRRGDRATVELSIKTSRGVATDERELVGSTYGIAFADRGFRMRCGPADWTVFLHEALGPTPTQLGPLFERPWIAGVLAQRYPAREALTTRMVMLTRPVGDAVRLEFARADGAVMYVGDVRRTGGDVGFTVADVDRPGRAPTQLSGTLTTRGISVRGVVLATRSDVRTAEDVSVR